MAKTSKNYPRYDEPFPKRIRELLTDTNTSAQTLGDYLGISQQAVNLYGFGEAMPTVERLIKIAQYFKVPTDYLLGLSDVDEYKIEAQAASKRYGLGKQDLQNLERLTVMARLHEKYQRLTDGITKLERTLKDTRNDNPTKDFIKGVLNEQNKLQTAREALEVKMLEAVDPGEGYIKPPKWSAPIRCRKAWQKLHAIGALLTLEQGEQALGEQALDEIGEYLYMGDMADGIIRYSNGTPERRLTKEEVADLKLLGVTKRLIKVRHALTPQ